MNYKRNSLFACSLLRRVKIICANNVSMVNGSAVNYVLYLIHFLQHHLFNAPQALPKLGDEVLRKRLRLEKAKN